MRDEVHMIVNCIKKHYHHQQGKFGTIIRKVQGGTDVQNPQHKVTRRLRHSLIFVSISSLTPCGFLRLVSVSTYVVLLTCVWYYNNTEGLVHNI